MIKIAVMGYGTIGSGVVQVIDTNQDSICKKTVTANIIFTSIFL